MSVADNLRDSDLTDSDPASHKTRQAYDELSSDFAKLRKDFSALRSDIGALSASGAKDAKEKIKEGVSSAEEHTRDAVEAATGELAEIQRQTEKAVRKNPLTAVAGALAIGYFLATLRR